MIICFTCGQKANVKAGQLVYWAPNVFNNLATVLFWSAWCALACQTHAANTLPVQQLCKQTVRFHTEGPLSLGPHWSWQAWKAPLNQSGGIWVTNATLRRRNLRDSGKQLTTQFALSLPSSSTSSSSLLSLHSVSAVSSGLKYMN